MDEKSIAQKLNAPKKVSGFERQRQEAETKRLREEAETRKALREFEDSFADEDEDDDPISALAGGRGGAFGGGMRDAPSGPRGAMGGAMAGSLGGPRHFGQSMKSSGPGTLGPPPSLKRKRELEEERERREREERGGGGMRGFSDHDDRSRQRKSPEPTVKRPTMLLSQLPKSIKQDTIKQVMPPSLKVEDIAFVPPAGPGTDRRYLSAIVTVSADTPMSDVDSAVSTLNAKYLGFGCYLKISRHITSSVGGLGSALGTQNIGTMNDFQPFGAKQFIREPQLHSLRNAPPPDSLDTPPYGYQGYGQQRHQGPTPVVVAVTPPSDLKLLKAIHRTVENVIKYGPAFERALLSSPDVQHDEQWAWIFDATSQPSIYYRWLIYEYYSAKTTQAAKTAGGATPQDLIESEIWSRTPEGQFAKKNGLIKLFDQGPLWQPPRDRPKFEFVFEFEDLVEDSGYVSSDDESGDEGNSTRPGTATTSVSLDGGNSGTANYLNPYRKAKFVHLLARLPDTLGLLRAGDVARITSFVVNNAGTGAEEIVNMLVENIELPYSRAVVYNTALDDPDDTDPDDYEIREKRLRNEEEKKKSDPSNAKLIALYVVSDAIQSSGTSGVRDAWKYRALFETALRSRNIFEHLGRLEKELNWGRMKAEQWKRKVGVVLGLWEKWSVFSAETQKAFKESFLNPALTPEEQAEKEKADREEKEKKEGARWKSGTSTPTVAPGTASIENDKMDVDASAKEEEDKRASEQKAKEDAEAKKKDFADRMATIKKNARASRPTAADLLDKREEPPAPAPAPKISVGSFKMSLGSGGSGGGLLLGKKAEPEVQSKGKERRGPAEMFADSDGE